MDPLIEKIKKFKKVALSGDEVLRLTENKANLITYPELNKYDNIEEILKPFGACIILYETKKNYGHWVCLIERGNNNIEFFDSYGKMIDHQLKFIPEHFRVESKQKYTLLTYLLLKSGKKIEYNNYKLQSTKNDINTCGRWCAIRIKLKHINIDDFANIFISNPLENDLLITYISMNI